MKRSSVKLLMVGLILTSTLQTGCLLVGGPLGAIGLVAMGAGGTLVYEAKKEGGSHQTLGQWMFVGGLVLDQKNPGRVDGLNVLPINDKTSAQFGVSQTEIQNYNDELPQVIAAHQNLIALTQNTTDLNVAAKAIGFKDGNDLLQTLQGDAANADQIQSFANSQNLSFTSAKIYLQTLGVKVSQ